MEENGTELPTSGLVLVVIAAAAIAGMIVFVVVRMLRVSKLPSNRPDEFLKPISTLRRGNPVVCCVGDSHTHGTYGFDWMTLISRRYPKLDFVNAGINGEQVHEVNKRLHKVVACKPALSIVIMGSNDRLSSCDRTTACAYGQCCGPKTVGEFHDDLDELVQRLLSDTSSHIALCSFPPVEAAPGTRLGRSVPAPTNVNDTNTKSFFYSVVVEQVSVSSFISLSLVFLHQATKSMCKRTCSTRKSNKRSLVSRRATVSTTCRWRKRTHTLLVMCHKAEHTTCSIHRHGFVFDLACGVTA
jgi:hypothetical protein